MDNRTILIPISASIAETCTFPVDYVKTLIQINKKGGFINFLKQTLKNDKMLIYNGLKPAIMRHCVYTTLRIKIYEHFTENKIMSNRYLIGGLSGSIAQLIASPLDLLKVRYITSNTRNKSIYGESRLIINEFGFLGLWRGATPNIARGCLVNFGELATYQYSKNIIKNNFDLNEGTPLHFMSGLISGFAGALCCTPADVIKSRLMKKNSQYTGVLNCFKQTIQNEGILALYKGLFPIWLRLAPWQIIFWTSYEKLRVLLGEKNF